MPAHTGTASASTRRAPGLHHVDVAEPRLVAETTPRPMRRTRFQRRVVDHQQGGRRALAAGSKNRRRRVPRAARRLGSIVRDDAAAFGPPTVRRCAGERAPSGGCSARDDDAFDACIVDVLARASTRSARHAIQHLVARDARGFRMAVGTQPARRLRQDRKQGRFGLRQARGRLAEIGPARGFARPGWCRRTARVRGTA